jgi:hypothetical protein
VSSAPSAPSALSISSVPSISSSPDHIIRTISSSPEHPVSAEPSKLAEPSESEEQPESIDQSESPDLPVPAQAQFSPERKWAMVKEGVRKEKPALFPVLQQATLDSVTEDTVTLSFPKNFSFYLIRINEESSRSVVQKWCRQVFGAHCRLECRTKDAASTADKCLSSKDKSLTSEEKEGCTSSEIDDIIRRYPVIRTAMEMFSAQMVQSNVSFLRKDT